MANTFKNSTTQAIGTSATEVFVSPASTTTTVIGMSVCNITASEIFITVTLIDDSEASTTHIAKDVPVPAGSSLVIVGGNQKVILETADSLEVESDTAASVDVIVSMLQST